MVICPVARQKGRCRRTDWGKTPEKLGASTSVHRLKACSEGTQEDALEEVVVTGSRIARRDLSEPSRRFSPIPRRSSCTEEFAATGGTVRRRQHPRRHAAVAVERFHHPNGIECLYWVDLADSRR